MASIKQQRQAVNEAAKIFGILSPSHDDAFEAGFDAGLSHNQAKLDSERQERIEFNKQTQAKLDKLIAYIKGDLARSEIEEILNA